MKPTVPKQATGKQGEVCKTCGGKMRKDGDPCESCNPASAVAEIDKKEKKNEK